jgi:hypothetical protein
LHCGTGTFAYQHPATNEPARKIRVRNAYTGGDYKWLEIALKGAMAKYMGAAAPNAVNPSRYLTEALRRLTQQARYGRWEGSGAATARKVLLAVVRTCETGRRMSAVASIRSLALLTGSEPKSVDSALTRLIASGRLHIVGRDGDGVSEYAPIVGEMTTVVSKGESPPRGFPIDPLHDVWLGDGLTGRHSHVLDLVSVGVRRAKEIATAGGMGYDTAREALASLVEVGMLERQGTAYSVPADVVEIADRLAVELGGRDRRAKLSERIREERARPRGDAVRLMAEDVADVDTGDIYEDERRWHEEELMRQLGMI